MRVFAGDHFIVASDFVVVCSGILVHMWQKQVGIQNYSVVNYVGYGFYHFILIGENDDGCKLFISAAFNLTWRERNLWAVPGKLRAGKETSYSWLKRRDSVAIKSSGG